MFLNQEQISQYSNISKQMLTQNLKEDQVKLRELHQYKIPK
jgi:hypothetical protein